MKKILGIIILLLAIGVTVYLLTNNDEEQTDMQEDNNFSEIIKKDPKKKFEEDKIIDTPLQFSLEKVDEGTGQFIYNIHNAGDTPETLAFKSGQRYEYEVYRDNELVVRYSDGMSFTQALADITLEPDETLPFEIAIPNLEPGAYTIDIYLVATDLASTSKITKNFMIETSEK